jgi:hypothetical protein
MHEKNPECPDMLFRNLTRFPAHGMIFGKFNELLEKSTKFQEI